MSGYKFCETIFYNEKKWRVSELLMYWNKGKPPLHQQTRVGLIRNMRNYAIRHEIVELDDVGIEHCLSRRQEVNGVCFGESYFRGLTQLYEYLSSIVKDIVSKARFAQAVKKKQEEKGQNETLSDDEYLCCARHKRVRLENGSFGSQEKAYYDTIPDPQKPWETVKKAINEYLKVNRGEKPSEVEIWALSKPEDWIVIDCEPLGLIREGELQPGISKLYERLCDVLHDHVCSKNAFGQRVRNEKKLIKVIKCA
jgi:hypothetical protein